MGATLKEGLPLKLVKKHGDAVSTAVVSGYTSGGPSLNLSSWFVSSIV